MKIIAKLISWYKVGALKKTVTQKMEQLNQISRGDTAESEKQSYPVKQVRTGKNDEQVKAYLAYYQSAISGIGAGWQPYLYELIDELIDNGLQTEDRIWAKEKYGSFRCGITAIQPDLQHTFDKIVEAYTARIDTICQFCNSKGTNQHFNDWEYNLCLHHYLAFKYNIPYDSEVDYYLGYTNDLDGEEEYRHLSAKPYHILDEHLFKQQAAALYRLLQEKWPDGKDSTREIMHRYFDETDTPVVALDNRRYRSHLQFVAMDDNSVVVDNPQADYYNRHVMQEGIIEDLFKQAQE